MQIENYFNFLDKNVSVEGNAPQLYQGAYGLIQCR